MVKVADANGNKGYVQLIAMATFENSHGESTAIITSNLGKQNDSFLHEHSMQACLVTCETTYRHVLLQKYISNCGCYWASLIRRLST